MPFFSIIIATYNSGKTLRRTIDSIINQSFSQFEIIIIDGCSKDDTMAIVDSYDKSYFGYCISEPDQGIYDAWNKGVEAAKGEWISFLGSDDYYMPSALEDYHNGIISSQKHLDYVSSKVVLTNPAGKKLSIIGKPWKWSLFRNYMCVAHVGSMHHNSLYKNFGLYDHNYKSSGDYELLLRAGKNINAAFMDKVTACMQYGGMSASSTLGFVETYRAKVNTASVSRRRAYIDHLFALARHWIRKFIYERT
jgi:glycosyltransferase involved in cell wall biosynthesis